MNETQHDELRALIAPYALGAVSVDELSEIRSHLMSCEECMADADELATTASSLGTAVAPSPVPKHFAASVLSKIKEPVEARPAIPSLWRRLSWGATAVSVAAAVVLAGFLVDARNDLNASRRTADAVLAHADLVLTGEEGVSAALLEVPDGSVFVASGLDEAPDERAYQLWLLEDGTPVSAGVFDMDEGVGILETSHTLEGYDAAAVTIEPASGSTQPTTEPILISG